MSEIVPLFDGAQNLVVAKMKSEDVPEGSPTLESGDELYEEADADSMLVGEFEVPEGGPEDYPSEEFCVVDVI
jgi:hypothetical protein